MPADLDDALSGLDALEFDLPTRPSRVRAAWGALWPKLAALTIVIVGWQLVVWSGWKPEYVLPGPNKVFPRLWDDLQNGSLIKATAITMRRALVGYAAALFIGTVVGVLVARNRVARLAVGSLITGLQTMPSIAWFPLAILLFGLNEGAIFFVVVLGAAPAIANGLIAGIDQIQPVLLKAGRVLGARGPALWRHIILPAALPGFVGGLKQGWAFAWRSLMAGELLVIIATKISLGVRLQLARELSDTEGLLAAMVVILVIGIFVDALVFGRIESFVRRRWGLAD
jgi:NitT/TauT family transport system permease protein